jgi:hypothetical protein
VLLADAEAARRAMRKPRDRSGDGPQAARLVARNSRHAAYQDERIHADIPRDQAEKGERKDVHALARPDAIDREPDDERGGDDRVADPRAPGHGSQSARDRCRACAEAFERERSATCDERFRRGTGADDFRRSAARPVAVFVAP